MRVNTSIIGQKGESQNGGNKNTKHAKFSKKQMFFASLLPYYRRIECDLDKARINIINRMRFGPLQPSVAFLYPLKTSENL